MSVPLDRLYNFLQDVCDHDVIIYRFFPYGSKNFADCRALSNYTQLERMKFPTMVCHDQECIDATVIPQNITKWKYKDKVYSCQQPFPWFKLANDHYCQFYNKVILLHSEINSDDVACLEKDGYIPVHYFSHALIARDWFRFAEYDPALTRNGRGFTNKFLIYNRAWQGSREYRIFFAEALVNHQLTSSCQTAFSFVDHETYYKDYSPKNPKWQITTTLEDYFELNSHSSSASADYQSSDYCACALEIVLETVFDSKKIHLTEKSLRPIAVGKPFMLVAAPGALQYLKNYGFETFGPWINESYDLIEDSAERLQAIIDEMKRLNALDPGDFQQIVDQCHAVALRNKQRFFSKEFFNTVVEEYTTGMAEAVKLCRSDVSRVHWDQWTADYPMDEDVSEIMRDLQLL